MFTSHQPMCPASAEKCLHEDGSSVQRHSYPSSGQTVEGQT